MSKFSTKKHIIVGVEMARRFQTMDLSSSTDGPKPGPIKPDDNIIPQV